jgi:hypothetical protein
MDGHSEGALAGTREEFILVTIERYGLDASWHLGNCVDLLLATDEDDALGTAQWYFERWAALHSVGRADIPAADDDVLLWALPEDVLAGVGLDNPSCPVAAMRGAAVTFLLQMTLGTIDPSEAIRGARLAIDMAVQKGKLMTRARAEPVPA